MQGLPRLKGGAHHRGAELGAAGPGSQPALLRSEGAPSGSFGRFAGGLAAESRVFRCSREAPGLCDCSSPFYLTSGVSPISRQPIKTPFEHHHLVSATPFSFLPEE